MAAYTLEHHHVLTNGRRLHVVQCGPADGELVLLLHGFPDFWYGWQHQMQVLAAASYQVWAPDQRGYNRSDKPGRVADYALPTLAADVLGLLEAAGRPTARLVGHDWGGLVAWYLAAHHPERFSHVSILNAPHPRAMRRALRQVPDQWRRSWYIGFFQLPRLPEWLFRRRDFAFGVWALQTSRPGTFTEADLARYKAAWSQPGALTGMINWYRALLRHPVRRWPPVSGPVQLIWGERDAFLHPRLAELSAAEGANVTLHRLPGVSHWAPHEAATEVNRLLLDFWQSAG